MYLRIPQSPRRRRIAGRTVRVSGLVINAPAADTGDSLGGGYRGPASNLWRFAQRGATSSNTEGKTRMCAKNSAMARALSPILGGLEGTRFFALK